LVQLNVTLILFFIAGFKLQLLNGFTDDLVEDLDQASLEDDLSEVYLINEEGLHN
jgi:hypothetical protein